MATTVDEPPRPLGSDRPDWRRVLPVTVVIPAHDRERLLPRAIRSVLVQRPRPAEIVVVDDASTDRTAAVAEAMGARVVRHERNLGEGPARNSGLDAATQPWVALLDSDDEWLPGHLGALWRGRGEHVLVATSSLRCSDDPRRDRFHGAVRGRPLVLASPRDIIFPEHPVPLSAVMVRREVALAAGGYRALRHCADFDFTLRCLEFGTGVVLPEVGMVYHLHEGQVSREDKAMKEAHTRIVCSYSDRPWFDPRQLRRWRAAVAWDTFRRDGGVRLAAALARPWYLPALLRLWLWRWRQRRRGAQLSREIRALAMCARVGEIAPLPAYAIVTPVRDEVGNLRRTAASVLAQSHPPARWVIVDDGSTDGTRELAERLARREPWIHVVDSTEAGDRARGARVVRAFQRGHAALNGSHEIVVKLDADIELPPEYFERVASTFALDRRAGIVGGRVYVPGRDGWEPEHVGRHTVHGAIKAYRVACLDEIGGLRPSMGWDGIDEYCAKARGWKVIPLPGLRVLHHAPRGSKQRWWQARFEEGRGARYMGYLPWFVLLRAGYRMFVERPPVLGGLAIMAGWLAATAERAPVVDDPLAVARLRAEQRSRLARRGSVEPDVPETAETSAPLVTHA